MAACKLPWVQDFPNPFNLVKCVIGLVDGGDGEKESTDVTSKYVPEMGSVANQEVTEGGFHITAIETHAPGMGMGALLLGVGLAIVYAIYKYCVRRRRRGEAQGGRGGENATTIVINNDEGESVPMTTWGSSGAARLEGAWTPAGAKRPAAALVAPPTPVHVEAATQTAGPAAAAAVAGPSGAPLKSLWAGGDGEGSEISWASCWDDEGRAKDVWGGSAARRGPARASLSPCREVGGRWGRSRTSAAVEEGETPGERYYNYLMVKERARQHALVTRASHHAGASRRDAIAELEALRQKRQLVVDYPPPATDAEREERARACAESDERARQHSLVVIATYHAGPPRSSAREELDRLKEAGRLLVEWPPSVESERARAKEALDTAYANERGNDLSCDMGV